MSDLLLRLMSYAWPVRVWRGEGRYGPLELTWEYGHLVVNSQRANQAYGSVRRVWRACFRDADVVGNPPESALIIGFGAGCVARILRNELRLSCPIIGLDGDVTMLELARRSFHVDRLGDLKLIEMDAFAFMRDQHSQYDLVIVDLFTELDFAEGVESPAFIRALRRSTGPHGTLCINTVVHDAHTGERSARCCHELRLCFDHVEEHRYEGQNRVFIAR